jgi:uncharacterized BrkB/YihY/UPF0761 family membrane protein
MSSHAAARRRPGTSPLEILRHPGSFVLCVLKGFRANQGLLLAGAVAYYTLLSMIPLLILMLIALSNFIDEARLFATLSEYLQFVVPGQADALVSELRHFLRNRTEVGGILLVTMILFSALAFTVLENAMSVIFIHRVAVRRRRFIVSALLPYLFILLLGVVGEILMLTAIYLVMPVGRLSFRHALIGGISAGLLWEITRHILVWYYGTISQVRLVYGSLATAITVMLSVEIAAIVLLLGAQVIAEYERIGRERTDTPPKAMDLKEPSGRAPA